MNFFLKTEIGFWGHISKIINILYSKIRTEQQKEHNFPFLFLLYALIYIIAFYKFSRLFLWSNKKKYSWTGAETQEIKLADIIIVIELLLNFSWKKKKWTEFKGKHESSNPFISTPTPLPTHILDPPMQHKQRRNE